ncbi:speckle-type POZ protein-like [Planococcus citri]|uniref:speckle-type POZ protein-like n=1 Tax=Planococcus citri TaxID=170843 RepID=UPI0031F7C331
MNQFYMTFIVLFAPHCICQREPLQLAYFTPKQTYLQPHEIQHTWIIRQFSLHEKYNTSEILSPMLHAPTTDEYEWYLQILPNYIDEGTKTVSLRVYLSKNSTVREATAMTNVSIIDDKKQVLHSKNFKTPKECIAGARQAWGWLDFCIRDYFFRTHLLRNDTLTLSINIKWSSEHSHEVVQTNPVLETTIIKCNHSENYASMLGNPEFADVVFITNGGNYPAHKSILAAQSPVFAAMFRQKDTKNGKNKKIRINVSKNIDEEVLHAMLRYIYTGKCDNFEKLADKLFLAAAKYGLDGLRKICEKTLCKTLSIKNAAKLLVFAEEHHANLLKSKAEEFIANNRLKS